MADAQRSLHLGTAPPLGRRLTALTVIASTLASVAVLVVAIPRGIEEQALAEDDDITTTTISTRTKNALKSSLAVMRGSRGSTTALSLGNGKWIVSTEALKAVGPSQKEQTYSVVKSDDTVGLSVITVADTTSAPAVDLTRLHERLAVDQLASYTIFDAFQNHEAAPEPSFTLNNRAQAQPVNMETPIKGLAVVINKSNDIIGILVRHHHAVWSVTRDVVMSLTAP